MLLHGKCFACPDDSFFSKEISFCMKCGEGSYIDYSTESCVLNPTCSAKATFNK